MNMKLRNILFGAAFTLATLSAQAQENVITVNAKKLGAPIQPTMYGIFFEDIDLSLDGGIYAEMVRNRSFEDGKLGREQNEPLAWWDPVGAAYLSADVSKPLSRRNARCVRVEARPGAGIANQGYFGMNVEKGKRYNLSVALRGEMAGPIEVSFEAFGKVDSVRVVTNRFNNKSKGFAFVVMPNRPEAEKAIAEMNDKEVMGRPMRVNEAQNSNKVEA